MASATRSARSGGKGHSVWEGPEGHTLVALEVLGGNGTAGNPCRTDIGSGAQRVHHAGQDSQMPSDYRNVDKKVPTWNGNADEWEAYRDAVKWHTRKQKPID